MGHHIKFPEHVTGYAYIQLTAHVLWSHSCTMMGTFPHHFKKNNKKKTYPIKPKNVDFSVLFPPKCSLPVIMHFLNNYRKKNFTEKLPKQNAHL